jgi:hypothetical protein
MTNFVKRVLDAGGDIAPLIVPSEFTNGTGIFNPAIYNDDGKLLCNIRHCQVTIYHSEKSKFEHQWGPLSYLNPENDITLTTTNYFCEIGDDLLVKKFNKIDTSKLDVPPIWEFRGLEDGRVVRWDGKLFICGVRRDTTTNGQGRMELSELEVDDNGVREISRFRIPAPGADDSYCEKNWMPVLDMPYHFVKWSNPTEVVKVDPVNKTCEVVFTGNYVQLPFDLRGSSQVITVGNYRIAVAHLVNLFKSEAGRKNATYRHSFIVWDKNWNILKYGAPFAFLDSEIEFCAGMCLKDDNILISFGVTDNSAYLMRAPLKFIEEFINE